MSPISLDASFAAGGDDPDLWCPECGEPLGTTTSCDICAQSREQERRDMRDRREQIARDMRRDAELGDRWWEPPAHLAGVDVDSEEAA